MKVQTCYYQNILLSNKTFNFIPTWALDLKNTQLDILKIEALKLKLGFWSVSSWCRVLSANK